MLNDWREIGDVSLKDWMTDLARVGSPILVGGELAYEVAKPHTRLALAMSYHESKHATVFNLNKPENKNPLNLKPRRRGSLGLFQQFGSYADCFAEWKSRLLDPTYAYAHTTDIESLVSVYAPSIDNNDEAAYVAALESHMARYAPYTGGTNEMATKRIILNMGHRDLTGGGTAGGSLTERGFTDDIVLACERALKALGVEVFVNQRYDDDADDTMLNRNLDWVGRTASAIDSSFGPVDAYLSIHLEGSQARGVFAIVPDATGLIAYATKAADAGDSWANNPLDVTFARALAKHCSASTGLGKRATTEPGVMSERATGVGGQGWRLSEFHETMPIRTHATRNILECGALPNADDRAIITAPGFPERIAEGVVAAFAEVFGLPSNEEPEPVPTPEPEPEDIFTEEEWKHYWGNDVTYNPAGRVVSVWKEFVRKTGMVTPCKRRRMRHVGGVDYYFGNGLVVRYADQRVRVLGTDNKDFVR
jgi:N-acetylmuramoyl-L-alanine amidase